MTHVINRLKFEATCANEAQAFAVRNDFANSYQAEVMSVMEQVCNELTGEDMLVQIERLDIDLGRINPDSFEQDFSRLFRQELEKQLREKINEPGIEDRKFAKAQSGMELIRYFLLHGKLPWWVTEAELDFNAIVRKVTADEPLALAHFLLTHQQQPNVWKRAALQLDVPAQTAIVQAVPQLNTALVLQAQLLIALRQLSDKTVQIEQESKLVLYKTIETIAANPARWILLNAVALLVASGTQRALAEIIINGILEATQSLPKAAWQTLKQTGDQAIKIVLAETALSSIGETPEVSEYKLAEVQTAGDENEKWLVHNAGIILLAPFFKPFFTTLQLLDGNEWKDSGAQEKAIYLLQFLSTGKQQSYEYQLTLEKLLCGWPQEVPLNREIVLSAEEMEEAVNLLKAAVSHWEVLKNTSFSGLRQTFLQREGLLSKRDNGWKLNVERKTVDVLLESIPWGFSMVTLPWNNYIIFTEW